MKGLVDKVKAHLAGTPADAKRAGASKVYSQFKLVVPLYIHPSEEAWAQFERDCETQQGGQLRIVAIINPNNGVGRHKEDEYAGGAARLRGLGVAVLGYVFTGYGKRALNEIVDESRAYREWYGVDGIFFDEVASDAAHLQHYKDLVRHVKGNAAQTTVINVGTRPEHPGYHDLADIVVTLEESYVEFARQFKHHELCCRSNSALLLHTTPKKHMADALCLAEKAGYTCVYVTDACMNNPWDKLPSYFVDLLHKLKPSS